MTMSAHPPAPSRASPYREIAAGGAWAPRVVNVGDRVGQSVVLRDLGVASQCRRFEITCHHCDCIQIRSTGQINAALRYGRPLVCPKCVGEGYLARKFEVQDRRLERVLAGGPMYTAFEIDDMCSSVLNDLEAEFGPSNDDTPISEMTIAVGWPYSAHEKKKTEDAVDEYVEESAEVRAWRREMNNVAFAKRDAEYRMALERAAAAQTDANRKHWKILRRAYQREQEVFAERARDAAKALDSFEAVGGRLDTPPIEQLPSLVIGSYEQLIVGRIHRAPRPHDPCPCDNGLTFSMCHGFTIEGESE